MAQKKHQFEAIAAKLQLVDCALALVPNPDRIHSDQDNEAHSKCFYAPRLLNLGIGMTFTVDTSATER